MQKAYEESKSNESDPEDEIKKICKNDKYCLEAGAFFLFILNTMEVDAPNDLLEDMLEALKTTKNYKQTLYALKYHSSLNNLRHYLIDFEASKLEKLTKFDEIKAYILDMPLTYTSFIKALKKMKAAANSQKELDFVDSFINKYTGKFFPQDYEKFDEAALAKMIKSSNSFCPKSLIVDNYGYNNLCILPFPPVIKTPQNNGNKTIQGEDESSPKHKEEIEEPKEEKILAYFE